MRQADVLELELSTGHSPLEALAGGFTPDSTWVGLHSGVPEVIFGIVPHPQITGWGIPWMLGTDNISKFKTEFIRNSFKVIDHWSKQYEVLTNYVHSENTLSKLWLKKLGFVIFPEAPYGIAGANFNLFMRKR